MTKSLSKRLTVLVLATTVCMGVMTTDAYAKDKKDNHECKELIRLPAFVIGGTITVTDHEFTTNITNVIRGYIEQTYNVQIENFNILNCKRTGNRAAATVTVKCKDRRYGGGLIYIEIKADENQKPKIKASDKVIEVGDEFNPLQGVTASDNEDGDLTSEIKVTNNVDTTKAGNYDVEYSVTDNDGATDTVIIEVTVKAKNQAPVITAPDITMYVGDNLDPLKGVTVTDDYDKNLKLEADTSKVNTKKTGEYTIYYSAKDSSGLVGKATAKVTVKAKNQAPVITAPDITMYVGDKLDPLKGVTVTDDYDKNLKLEADTSKVNTKKAGEYTIYYSAKDSSGLEGKATAKVTVKERNQAPEIKAADKTIIVGDKFDPLEGVTASDKEDGDLTKKVTVLKNTVKTDKVGYYYVTYSVTDSDKVTTKKTVEVIVKAKAKNQPPTITALDKEIPVGYKFDPLTGVVALDKEDGNLTSKIVVTENTVDTSKSGAYKVIYSVTDSEGLTTTKTIYVRVQGLIIINSKPEIYAYDTILNKGDKFDPLAGVIALDVEDKSLTSKIQVIKNTVDTEKPGVYEVTYSVEDSCGAVITKTIHVTVRDNNQVPVITASNKTVTVGDRFDPLAGVTASDKEDGDLTKNIVVIKNTVNTSKTGVYEVIYSVKDSKKLTAIKSIYVTVKNRPIIIYINDSPVINAVDRSINMGEKFNPLDGVTAKDTEDGNLTSKLIVVSDTVDTTKAGLYEVVYKVTDSYGNTTNKTIKVQVVHKNEAPVITATDKTITVEDKFDPLAGVTASDKEDGDLTYKIEVLSNTVDTTKAGEYEVKYRVTDSNSVSDIKTIKVSVKEKAVVEENEAPVITATDKTITVEDKFEPLAGVAASDKEDGDLTSKIEVVRNTVDTTKAGKYEVEYKVTDSNSKSSSRIITVTVNPKNNNKPENNKPENNKPENNKPESNNQNTKPSADKKNNDNKAKTEQKNNNSNISQSSANITASSNNTVNSSLPKTGGVGSLGVIALSLGSILSGVFLKKKNEKQK